MSLPLYFWISCKDLFILAELLIVSLIIGSDIYSIDVNGAYAIT